MAHEQQQVEIVRLGQRYRDRVSGYEGTLTAAYVYLNGCVRYEVSGADKDGKPESFVFDEAQLEPVPEPAVETEQRRTGGPRGSAPVPR